jgi:RNA polymerase sigma factor (sigma-70 family)
VSAPPSFETLVLPWLDAGYNLARWLLRDEAAADDVVQVSALRALRYFHSLRGADARPWFLGIVRNECYTVLKAHTGRKEHTGFEDDALEALQFDAGRTAPDPAALFTQGRERAMIDAAIAALSPPLREVIVLRELEGLEYAEIAAISAIPIGTVMSRLSRARAQLKATLVQAGLSEGGAR